MSTSSEPAIVLFADARDRQAAALAGHLAAAGLATVTMPLERVPMATDLAGDPLRLPGFDGRLPRAAFVRSISAGSFQAVTLRLGVLHGLERAGVRVVNRPRAIEACVDKSMTSLLVARAGLPTPETFVTEDREAAMREVARREPAPMVLKPLFGAQGKGLALVGSPADLPDPTAVDGVYYLQRFVAPAGSGFTDFRLLVSGGRVVAAMRRRSDNWVTNVHQGGRPEAWTPGDEAERLAIAAAAAVGADLAGVDLIADTDGRLLVLEVNSMPAWSGLQTVTGFDIAAVVAGDLAALATEATS